MFLNYNIVLKISKLNILIIAFYSTFLILNSDYLYSIENNDDKYKKEYYEALDIIESVFVTNTNNGFYITFKKYLRDNVSVNNIINLEFNLTPIKSTYNREFDDLRKSIFELDNEIIKIRNINPNGTYISNIKNDTFYKITILASSNHGILLEKNIYIKSKQINKKLPIIKINNNFQIEKNNIDFNPENSALLLIDFLIDNDDNHPRYHVVNEFRKMGIPIFHYMHEFINIHGMSEILLPLQFSDFIVRNDNVKILEAASNFNRQNDIKNIFVMGYGAAVCVKYTRFNSVDYLSDLYPNVKILPIEEGITSNSTSDKWAISQFRSSTGTVSALDILNTINTNNSIIKNISDNYMEKFNKISSYELVQIDKYRKKLNSLENKILIISNLSESNKVNKKKILKLKTIFEKNNLPIVEIRHKKLYLNNVIYKLDKLLDFINNKSLKPIITGFLSNKNIFWRSGNQGDYYNQDYNTRLNSSSIFVKDLLETNVFPPFSDFGFNSDDSIQNLIHYSSLYSSTYWINSEDFDNFVN